MVVVNDLKFAQKVIINNLHLFDKFQLSIPNHSKENKLPIPEIWGEPSLKRFTLSSIYTCINIWYLTFIINSIV